MFWNIDLIDSILTFSSFNDLFNSILNFNGAGDLVRTSWLTWIRFSVGRHCWTDRSMLRLFVNRHFIFFLHKKFFNINLILNNFSIQCLIEWLLFSDLLMRIIRMSVNILNSFLGVASGHNWRVMSVTIVFGLLFLSLILIWDILLRGMS